MTYLFVMGLRSVYFFTEISIWFGVAIVTIWAIVITWRTKHGWGVWWAGW
jgi:hypothetical protein